MDFEKPCCPIVEVDGNIACGKQFDLDITLPYDNRNVIYGVIRDCCKEPVCDAVVKLVEIVCDCDKEERRPISHTFTDKEGEFVFGPLCPDKKYEINFWVDQVKHIKVCARCEREEKCLRGVKMDKCDCFVGSKPCHKDDKKCDCKHNDKCDCKHNDKCDCKEECKFDCRPDCKQECKFDCRPDCKQDCKFDCRPNCKQDCKFDCKKY